jgi:hypothetical protein
MNPSPVTVTLVLPTPVTEYRFNPDAETVPLLTPVPTVLGGDTILTPNAVQVLFVIPIPGVTGGAVVGLSVRQVGEVVFLVLPGDVWRVLGD